MSFLSILIDKSSVCLWRELKTIKLDFLKLIDSLLAWYLCVSFINSEFKVSESKLNSLWEKIYLCRQQRGKVHNL